MRVALYGYGNVGRQAAALLSRRAGVELMAIIGRSAAGEVAQPSGLVVEQDAAAALERTRPDLVLHATVPTLVEALPQLLLAVSRGCHVVSTCEELAYPWIAHPTQANQLDTAARQNNVVVIGTGVNPGYVFDALVLAALGPRWTPLRIEVSRVTDASGFGATVRGRLGLGIPLADFRAMTADGRIAGHIGFRESMDLCAAAMGCQVQSFREWFEPIDADREAQDVTHGLTAGFKQSASGQAVEGPAIDFDIVVHLWPEAIGMHVADTVKVLDGERWHELELRPACQPVETAAAKLVNVMPHVLVAEPGLRTSLDLPSTVPWIS
jgi:4-hydroxy-tetrahydrodipicolinate reductase